MPTTGQKCRKTAATIPAECRRTSHQQGIALANSQRAAADSTLPVMISTAGQYFIENRFAIAPSNVLCLALPTRRTGPAKIDNFEILLGATEEAGAIFISVAEYCILRPSSLLRSALNRFAEKWKNCSRSLQ